MSFPSSSSWSANTGRSTSDVAAVSAMARDWSDRTVMVTGGLGFIGSHFVEELLLRGAEVVCLHRGDRRRMLEELPSSPRLRLRTVDLRDGREVTAACRALPSADVIVHCAALDGNTAFKVEHGGEILDTNLRIASNVLTGARELPGCDVVMMSSAEIYSVAADHPFTEEDDHRREIRYSDNGYRLSKVFAEVLAELQSRQFGTRVFLPRPTNVYGPRDDFTPAGSRVIPSMLRRLSAGEEIEIWGDGNQQRSFVHVRDLVCATLQMVERQVFGPMNVAADESVSILELARLVARALEVPPRIRLDPRRPAGPAGRRLDLARMRGSVDVTPRPLSDGLPETVDWFRGHRAGRVAVRRPAFPIPGG